MANGLLDLMKSPAAMGLLAAGFGGLAGANRNTPINNLGRAGLAGLAGYSAADALQQKQAVLDQEKKVRDAIPTFYKTGPDGKTTFDAVGAAQFGIDPKLIADYANVPNAGRVKVARTMTVPGADGKPMTVQYDDYGAPVGEGVAKFQAPVQVNDGASVRFVDPVAGQTFQLQLSPAEILANQRGQQNIALRQQNNQILSEANEIQKTAARTHVEVLPDGSIKLIDKGTGNYIEPTSPTGQPMPKVPQKLTEGEGKASIYLSQMQDATRTLGTLPDVSPVKVGATGSAWTNWMAPADAQKAAQAQRQWAESFLRAKTGAAATQQEVEGNIQTFFPVVGDTPEVIKSKAAARAQAEQDMTLPAGRGADRIIPVNEAPAANTQGGTAVGTVEDGYVFMGGDDTNPANWKKQ